MASTNPLEATVEKLKSVNAGLHDNFSKIRSSLADRASSFSSEKAEKIVEKSEAIEKSETIEQSERIEEKPEEVNEEKTKADPSVFVSAPTSVTSSESPVVVSAEADIASKSETDAAPAESVAATTENEGEATAPVDAPSAPIVSADNAFQTVMTQAMYTAKDGLAQLEKFAEPYVQRMKPYTETAIATIMELWGKAVEGCKVLLEGSKTHYDKAMVKTKEALKPMEPMLTQVNGAVRTLGEKAGTLAATGKEQVNGCLSPHDISIR